MKTMDRLYERLTPTERFKIAVAAFGRGDFSEVDRLNDSTGWRNLRIQDPAYFDRLQHITWLALYFTGHARNLQVTVLAAFSAMMIHLLGSDTRSGEGEAEEDDDEKFDDLADLCQQRMSRLKALYAAWEAFCTALGISASDIDKMIGMPLMGGLGQLELIQEVVGEVPLDDQYRQECLGHIKSIWKTGIEDRYASCA